MTVSDSETQTACCPAVHSSVHLSQPQLIHAQRLHGTRSGATWCGGLSHVSAGCSLGDGAVGVCPGQSVRSKSGTGGSLSDVGLGVSGTERAG